MPTKTIKEFKVNYLQVLDKDGNCHENPKLSSTQIKDMYKYMVISRIFDDRALKLQRQGRIGTYPSILGQEAAQVGSAYALDKNAWIFPSFREHASMIIRGVPMDKMYLYYAGDERGNLISKNTNCFTTSVPVATHLLHAVGFAWSKKLQKKIVPVVAYFGDGATSEGDFHEALNFAGVFKLPVIFICQNNQYAISVPRSRQSASETLAQKAIAYGFSGIQVDGNDVFAVYKATKEALANAKKGIPTFIECFTYRISDHTTADDASRYRSKKEVDEWKKKDPILRLKKYMLSKKIWSEKEEAKLIKLAEDLVSKSVHIFETVKQPESEDIFKYMFKEMPWNLKEQLNSLKGAGA